MEFPPAIVHEVVIDHKQVAAKHLAEMSPVDLDEDWRLDEFFGCVYIINLPQATERLATISENLLNIGLDSFKIFQAVDGRKDLPPTIWRKFWKNWTGLPLTTPEGRAAFDHRRKGEAGCYMSHLRLLCMVKKQFEDAMKQLKEAKAAGDINAAALAAKTARQFSSVLILEDDNGFGIVHDKNTISVRGCGLLLRQMMRELPTNWDMLYFTLWTWDPVHPFSAHLCLIQQTYGTHCYAVNYRMYNDLVKFLKRIESPGVKRIEAIDKELAGVFPGHRIFAVKPSIAYQAVGKSYITGKEKLQPTQNLH